MPNVSKALFNSKLMLTMLIRYQHGNRLSADSLTFRQCCFNRRPLYRLSPDPGRQTIYWRLLL